MSGESSAMHRVGLSALCVLLLSLAPTVEASGSILAEKTDLDLGLVCRDEPQEMVFPIRNVSADTLHIVSVEPSCDCTTAQVVPEAVPPQGGAEVRVFFDPAGYEGRGRVTESVRLHTTDRQSPEVLFTFTIEVLVGPEPEPRSLAFGRIAKGVSDTLAVIIRPGKTADLRITAVRSDNDKLRVARAGKTPEGAEQIAVVIDNASGGGQLAGFVTVETDDSLKPEIRIPVTASLLGDITVDPDVIAFGPTLPGKAIPQTIRVESPAGIKFKIASITSAPDCFDFDIVPASSGYQVSLTIRESAPPGRVAGEITVRTDRKNDQPLTVKVTGHIRSTR